MIETLKKTIYAGLGAALVTKDKVENTLNEFVKTGKITADEASEIAEKIVSESKQEFNETKEQITNTIEEWFSEAKWVTQKQFQDLEARIEKLESENKEGPH